MVLWGHSKSTIILVYYLNKVAVPCPSNSFLGLSVWQAVPA